MFCRLRLNHSFFTYSLVLLVLVFGLLVTPAQAKGGKLALVVGNAAYENLPGLQTPTEDAQAMSSALRDLGFEVTVLTDVSPEVFQAVLGTFAKQAQEAETVLFYYSGHALQLNGVNHLVPVSAKLAALADVGPQTWALDDIARQLKSKTGQLLIFLDACRDNPLPEGLAGGTSSGLAQYDGGAGTFVSFATAPGMVSWDSVDGSANSPYTSALLARMATPGQSLSDLMIAVRNDVSRTTSGKQTPWEQSSLRSQFFFSPAIQPIGDLPDFDVVDAGSQVLVEQTVLALADTGGIQGVDSKGKLRLDSVNSETRSLAAVAPANVRISGQDATAPVVADPAVTVPDPAELPRAVQTELERIGCYAMAVDGDWGNGSRGAMRSYYDAKGQDVGEVEPTEAVYRALAAEPENTCEKPAPVAAAAKAPTPKAATKKAPSKAKKAAAPAKKTYTAKKPAAPAPAKKKGVTCKFVVVAVVCS